MDKTSLTALFADAPELQQWWPQLVKGRHLLTGLTGSAKTLLIEAAVTRVGHPLLVVANDRNHAEELVADLGNRLAASLLYQFAVDDVLSLEAANTSLDERNDRIAALNFLVSDQPGVVVTTLAGLRRLLPPVADWQQAGVTIKPDSEVDPAALATQLVLVATGVTPWSALPGSLPCVVALSTCTPWTGITRSALSCLTLK